MIAIHEGRDTYNQHTKKRTGDDFYYNSQYYDDRFQGMSSLRNCKYRLRRSYRFLLMVVASGDSVVFRRCKGGFQ